MYSIIGRERYHMQNRANSCDMSMINKKYEECCNTASDINRLLPLLKKYSEECSHITEMGVRNVTSTWAFLAGKPERLISYDIIEHPNIKHAVTAAGKAGIGFEFREEDVLDVVIEETDLLFLDTFHHYDQLSRELRMHNDRVKKYIIAHDTTTYGRKNEKMADDCYRALHEKGKDPDKYLRCTKEGLLRAIKGFLRDNKNWKIKERVRKNNGLTVLSRA